MSLNIISVLILNFEGYQNGMIGSKVTAILTTKNVFFFSNFLKVLFIPFTNIESQVEQLQLVSELAILVQKWFQITNFWVLKNHC